MLLQGKTETQTITLSQKTPWESWLALIIVAHIVAWTVLPYALRFNLPLDAIEGSIWGQQLQWGYDKNPYLSGWLTGLATLLDNHAGWGTYFFSQLAVGICFWAVWRLGSKILPPAFALLGVMLLEGVQYYSLHAIDFNDNTLELALWSLTVLNFYNALHTQRYRDWLLTGVCAGFSMMTKYYTLMLLAPMLAFLLFEPQNRAALRNGAPYAGLLVFLIIIAPHVVWLFSHDFSTVHYALERVNRPEWAGHFNFSYLFAWQQIETFIPALLLALFLLPGKKPLRVTPRLPVANFDKQFLFYVGLAPFLLTVLLSIITGIKLRAGWGEPLLSYWGIMLIAWWQPRMTPPRFKLFSAAFILLIAATLTGYGLSLVNPQHPSRANFPGRMIAARLTREWHNTYQTPLFYVAGSAWLAGNVAYYSLDHPAVLINWSKNNSPGSEETELQQKGGVFVWELAKNQKLTPELLRHFPRLAAVKILHFKWWRHSDAEPVSIAVAMLPPAQPKQTVLIYPHKPL
jgi:4-amino-4-deoxy-L-arabinose transferase-like glycosyltransferase